MHIRTQIREKVKEIVQTAVPDATVFDSLAYSVQEDDFPAINILTPSEEIRESQSQVLDPDRPLRLQCTIQISLYVRGDSSVATADDYCEAIQEALAQNYKLDGLCSCLFYEQFVQDLNAEGDGAHAMPTLTYTAWYDAKSTDFSSRHD